MNGRDLLGLFAVMDGLDPSIHVFAAAKTRMATSSAAMARSSVDAAAFRLRDLLPLASVGAETI